jgi:hypothetical protein
MPPIELIADASKHERIWTWEFSMHRSIDLFWFFFLWPGTTCKIEFRRVAVKIPSVLLFPCRPTNPTHFHLHSDVRGQNWVAVGWRRRKLQRRRGSLKRPPRAPALGRASWRSGAVGPWRQCRSRPSVPIHRHGSAEARARFANPRRTEFL